MNILVIKLSALGDFILAMGAMEAIRRHHPEARLTLLTTKPFADMAQRSGWFDHIEVTARTPFHDIPAWLKLGRFLNGGGFSRVYDLQLNDRTSFYYRLFRKKPEWSGIVKSAKLFYANPEWRQMHAFDRHKTMLAELGITVSSPDLSWMKTDVSFFGLKKPYVLLAPGSAPQHPEKRWSAVKFAALALKLGRQGYDVALLGTAADDDAVTRIKTACPAAHDLSGRTSFYDIASLSFDAAAAVGNDTGPMHLIALAGCPSTVLFSGTTDPALSVPLGAVAIQSMRIDDISVDDVMKNMRFTASSALSTG